MLIKANLKNLDANNTFISPEVMQKAIDKYMAGPDQTVYLYEEPVIKDPKNAFGKVEKLELDNDKVMCEINVNSKLIFGNIIETLMKQGAKITFGMRGTVDKDDVKVNAYDIINIEPEHENRPIYN